MGQCIEPAPGQWCQTLIGATIVGACTAAPTVGARNNGASRGGRRLFGHSLPPIIELTTRAIASVLAPVTLIVLLLLLPEIIVLASGLFCCV